MDITKRNAEQISQQIVKEITEIISIIIGEDII